MFRAYQERKAIKNPNHEKKKTLPYLLNGFKAGMDFAFLLIGLTSGALKRMRGSNISAVSIQMIDKS